MIYLSQGRLRGYRVRSVPANTEAERIRQPLRQWQSRHTDCCHQTDAPHTRRVGNTSTHRTPGTANSG
ncbi:hypothetical protein [Salinispora cortesiana]|uniref:hypothetical protein n=1 Tax=Salinispora cortesiana TaxID=1305843 RepID=UPI0003F71F36|nr:hypothetical protein [Salinispora cortesiana]